MFISNALTLISRVALLLRLFPSQVKAMKVRIRGPGGQSTETFSDDATVRDLLVSEGGCIFSVRALLVKLYTVLEIMADCWMLESTT